MSQNSLPNIPSPCVGICKLDDNREYCIGCLRTVTQLRDWPSLDNSGRLAVIDEIQQKRDQLLGRKLKRRRTKTPSTPSA